MNIHQSSTSVFSSLAEEYDEWFDKHPFVFQSEVACLKKVVPQKGLGLEIGVGSGRFAEALGTGYGMDPALGMKRLAERRGIKIVEGKAEAIPFPDHFFEYVTMITTLCFVENPTLALQEASRVTKSGGQIIIGIIDRETALGKKYESGKKENPYYQFATFFSVNEVLHLMDTAGFQQIEIFQTLFEPLEKICQPETAQSGHGQGGFVVICGSKKIT